MQEILDPEACTTMIEVRAGVDAVDAALVALLKRRFGYMDAAARIKPERGHVRDEARKAQVIDNVRAHARAAGIPDAAIGAMWETLVEASIAYEFEAFDQR
ncbi:MULTISPECIES: chorismate mutase [unclassified Sphingomonas]|uniref:chorismate mutase n=1 Tax=unclassified Sphingomonas TaxID=196159 RepID=UPI0022B489FB|nr:chorismate mutase [Sphingomonas sp. NIBR02145]WHU02226.1 chorismate mutase [Sphingomonas sp. NIBR02145]